MINLKNTLFAIGFGAMMVASVFAQGTAFTYQGRLNNGTNLATGTYNLAFTLFDGSTNGNVIGHPSTNFAVTVNGGLFTVPVDFGANAFTGATNWMQIAVGTNLSGLYTNLTPRQQLTPVPYAVYAEGANASGLVGTLAGNGGGLTNLVASQLSGTVLDGRLSANVALLNASQTFSGANTFSGNVAIGTSPSGVPLTVLGSASFGDGVIEGTQTSGTTSGYGIAGYSLIPGGRGLIGEADTELPNVTGPAASDIGVQGASFGTNGTGVFGFAGASTGVNYGVVGQTFSSQGYAGYFLGQSYFGGSVGMGTTSPAKQLDLTGTASGVAAGSSIDPSIFMRVNNTSSDGNTSVPDFAGIGFGHNSTRQAIVGGTFGNDFLDFYTGGSLTAPKLRIDINGTVGIMTNNVLELGYGVAGKESNAGKIGYEKFTADALDIVGAGTNSSSRKIKFWAEGGATFSGSVTATNFSGPGAGLTGVALLGSANTFTTDQTIQGQVIAAGSFAALTVQNRANSAQNWQWRADASGLNVFSPSLSQPLTINPNSNVGIGTTTPAGQLSVATPSGTVNIMNGPFTPELVMTGGGADGALRLRNRLEIWPKTNLTAAGFLDVRATNGTATITLDGTNGNVTCVAVNITSDRNAKEDFTALDPRALLAKVASLPITEWQYKAEKAGGAAAARHIGPMAQDFHDAFAVGTDDKHISVVDEGGVALAAIQGLNQKLNEKDKQIQELEKRLAELRGVVTKLAAQQAGGAK